MWHADEGALHVYLDGALDELPSGQGAAIREHIATCPECAARVEQEQRIREQAIGILSGPLLPQVELPPFEELRLRAEATSPPKVSTGSRLHRMGWAASVVLAIGAGWGLRGGPSGALGSMDVMDRPDLLPAFEASSTTPDQDASARDLLNEVVGRGGLSADVVASSERARPVTSARAEGLGVDAVVSEVLGVAPRVAEVEVTAMDVVTFDVVTFEDRLEGELTPSPLEENALPDFRASVGTTSRLGRTLPVLRVAAVPVASEDVRVERDWRTGRAVVTSASRSAVGAPLSNGGALQRRRERRDSGRRGGDEGPLVVPDFEVIVVEAIEEGAAAGGTRALQWLTPADTLELLHLPEGVRPGDLAPLEEDGIAELFVLRDGLWLVMRARRRSVQELEGLLERLDANR